MAVEAVLGGEMVWYSEFEHYPSKLLEQRFPGVPNHGDLTKIDWNTVEPIDILTGGYPCQPFSQAGKRKGEDDPRHLWPYIREAVRVLRPRITILENVPGHRSKGFATVLRDCAEDGLNVRWVSVRASDAGAPHRRERLFFAITDPDVPGPQRGELRPRRYDPACERASEALPLLATPQARDSKGAPKDGFCESSLPRDVQDEEGWHKYIPAIRHWESLTRPAPKPTEPGRGGKPRIHPPFTEWMMGIPEGWVTGMDIPRKALLQLLGNGVVPQQAELAIRHLLDLTSHTQKASTAEAVSDE